MSSIGRPIGVNQRTARRRSRGVWRRALVVILLTVLLSPLLGSDDGAAVASTGAAADGIVPEIAAVVEAPSDVEDEWLAGGRSRLEDIDGVRSVTVGWPTAETTAFFIRLDDSTVARRSLDRITGDVRATLVDALSVEDDVTVVVGDEAEATAEDDIRTGAVEPARVLLGGRTVADWHLAGGYQATVWMLALLAVGAAAGVGFRFGRREAAVAAAIWPLSVLLAGSIGSQAVAGFNGTVVTTPVVAAVAGLVTAVGLGVRLLLWHESADEADGAGMVRSSVASIGVELLLVVSGFVAVLGLLWLLGAAVSPLVAVIVGTVIGGVFTAGVMAPFMAGLVLARPAGLGRPWSLGPNLDHPHRGHLLPFTVPSGERLSLLAVLGLGLGLFVLGGLMFRTPGEPMVDHTALDSESEAREVGELLAASGDPTWALVARLGDGTDASWLQRVSSNPAVAYVDVAGARFVAGAEQESVDGVSLLSGSVLDSLVPQGDADGLDALGVSRWAVIVPAVPVRSPEGSELFDDLRAASVGAAGLDGPWIDERDSYGSGLLLASVVLLLAVVAALAVHVATDNLDQAITTFVLRLLGGAAMAGLYPLVTGEPPVLETLAVIVIVSLVAGLFELEFLNGLEETVGDGVGPDASPRANGAPSTLLAAPPGQSALVLGVVLVAAGMVVALSRWFGSQAPVGRFGLGLAVVAVLELVVFAVALRPALLGQQAAFHAAARPVRRAVVPARHGLHNPDGSYDDDPTWHRVMSDLLLAEFLLENDPVDARPDLVFLPDTPIHDETARRIGRLRANGLRVSGRSPAVRQVLTIRDGARTALSVTVDEPERHLVDRSGAIRGVRPSRRRSLVAWLVRSTDGRYRLAEILETGSVPSPVGADHRAEASRVGSPLVGSGDQGLLR